MSCIFCDIVEGKMPCHKIWESGTHLAFLSIFPNTQGFSVVIPKQHYPSYVFDQDEEVLASLMSAAKQVGRLLDKAFDDVGRTGLIFEGFGVNHLHAKLVPMHGTAGSGEFTRLAKAHDRYFERYEGYISSHDFERADDAELAALAAKIRACQD
ncbi:HIT family protein [Granulosicoccaceae sp. 1_MG-2023]|nr:HIT family protein [Granulosicoccaceae sp. 1_MG-2023]